MHYACSAVTTTDVPADVIAKECLLYATRM